MGGALCYNSTISERECDIQIDKLPVIENNINYLNCDVIKLYLIFSLLIQNKIYLLVLNRKPEQKSLLIVKKINQNIHLL